jgi:hypothetical protein
MSDNLLEILFRLFLSLRVLSGGHYWLVFVVHILEQQNSRALASPAAVDCFS